MTMHLAGGVAEATPDVGSLSIGVVAVCQDHETGGSHRDASGVLVGHAPRPAIHTRRLGLSPVKPAPRAA